jgi:predicted dehydrogenase
MSMTLNWGILGAANFARKHMAPAIHAARGARLVALATSDASKVAPFQAFCPDLRVHADYDALLQDPGVDAVYIPLPNHLHVEWAAKALQAGKHVLVEKPVALRADEIDGLIALRDSTGLLAAEALMIAHHPQWQRTRDLVRSGAIGDLVHVDAVFSFNLKEAGNIRNQAALGGGGLRDIGVYTFGGVRLATGLEPEALAAAHVTWSGSGDGHPGGGVDLLAHVTGRFDGFTYSSLTSMNMAPYQRISFHGSEGWIELRAPFNAGVYDQATLVVERNGVREETRYPGVNQYVLQVEAFGRSALDGADYGWTLEDARGSERMIDRVFLDAAMRGGNPAGQAGEKPGAQPGDIKGESQ